MRVSIQKISMKIMSARRKRLGSGSDSHWQDQGQLQDELEGDAESYADSLPRHKA